jgi:hypothetical protein
MWPLVAWSHNINENLANAAGEAVALWVTYSNQGV